MKGWETKTLRDLLVALESGSRPKGGACEMEGGIPSVSGEHIDRHGRFYWTSPKHIPKDFFDEMKRGRIKHGDILVVKDGATTGKTAMVREDFPFSEAAINEHVFLLRTDQTKALQTYVGYFLLSPVGQQQILSNYRGAAIGGISQSFVDTVSIPIPPLAEQARIVKALDEAEELRKLRDKVDSRTALLLPALFSETFGDPKTNPKAWPLVRLGEKIRVQGGYAFKSRDFVENGIRLVKIANVHFENLSWAEKESLPMDFLHLYAPFSLNKGDILLALTRPIIKSLNSVKVARVTDGDLPCLLNQRVGRFIITRPDEVNPSYLQSYCYTGFFREQIESFCSVSLQPNVSTEQVESIPFLLPPISLQNEFAARVDEIREMKAAQSASHERLEQLFQSMLHRAFNGEL